MMIKIDVISPFSFSEIVGPVGTIKRILDNRDFFLSHKCDITVINKDSLLTQWIPPQPSHVKYRNKWRSLIKNKLDTWAVKSRWLSIILVEIKFRQRKKIVDKYIKMNRTPNILCFHSEIPCYYYLKRTNRPFQKIVLFFHNDGIPFQMLRLYYPKLEGSWYLRVLMKRYEYIVNNVDRCAFICQKGEDNINKAFPLSIMKSSLVINGIDDLGIEESSYIEKVRHEREAQTIINLCCVGSVSVRKGQRNVIEALGRMDAQTRNHYTLTIVGNGTDLSYCEKLVKDKGLEKNVYFVGAVPNANVYKYLACADVFILLSKNEGMPISIIEAMRAGLAIISTNVSGIPELVTKENGILIESTSDSLLEVLFNGECYDWKMMGKNSRKRYEELFTFERMRSDYVKMIYDTIGTN